LHHPYLDTFRHAFEVIVKLAAGGLAGTDASNLIDRLSVSRSRHEGIAVRVYRVADGDGAGMTTAAGVIYAIACHALLNNRHFKANSFHGMFSFQVIGYRAGLAKTSLALASFNCQKILFPACKRRYQCLPDYDVSKQERLLSEFVWPFRKYFFG
jgi:hypothetical protein